MAGQSYPDKTDVCKGAVTIPGISVTYVLNKSLEKNLSHIHHGVFVTYVEIYGKSSSTVVVMVPCNVVFIMKNVG